MDYRKYIPYSGLVVAILIVVSFFAYKGFFSTSIPVSTSTTTTISLSNGVSVTVGGGGVIKQLPKEPSKKVPSLDRPITFSSSLSAEAQAIMRSKIEEVVAALRKDQTRIDLWLGLGTDRKIVGDYIGAVEAWDYVVAIGSGETRATAYGNLGDLYMNFMKDYGKAEAHYKRAIEFKPTDIDYYRSLYTLYHYLYKVGTGADAAIITQGLKNNPGNPDLLQLQTQLKSGT